MAWIASLGQALAVAGDDEQRVVDTDAEPDHGHHLGVKVGADRRWRHQVEYA